MPRHKRVDSDYDIHTPWIDTANLLPPSHSASPVSPIAAKTSPVLTRTGKANELQRTSLNRDSGTTSAVSSSQPAAGGDDGSGGGGASDAGGGGGGAGGALMRYRGARVRLRVSATHVSWKPINPSGGLGGMAAGCLGCCGPDRRALARRVPFDEVLSAALLPPPADCCGGRKEPPSSWVLHSFRRAAPSGPRLHAWALEEHVLAAGSAEAAREAVAEINARVQKIRDRPRSLLVFLNPASGSRRARAVWERDAAPVFARARCAVTLVETCKQDHAREYVSLMRAEELGGYQGLVAVGGDGMFQELVAGLLARRARGESAPALRRLRLGHIPAGSTDAVAYTLHGTRCAVTAALHIALGDRLALDCGRVTPLRTDPPQQPHANGPQPPPSTPHPPPPQATAPAGASASAGGVRHFVCQAGYGFMGDVMRHSERLRWLGPGRYDISGALQYLRLPSYRVALSYREAPSTAADVQQLCTAQCEVCRMAGLDMGHAPPFRHAAPGSGSESDAGGGGGCPPPPPLSGFFAPVAVVEAVPAAAGPAPGDSRHVPAATPHTNGSPRAPSLPVTPAANGGGGRPAALCGWPSAPAAVDGVSGIIGSGGSLCRTCSPQACGPHQPAAGPGTGSPAAGVSGTSAGRGGGSGGVADALSSGAAGSGSGVPAGAAGGAADAPAPPTPPTPRTPPSAGAAGGGGGGAAAVAAGFGACGAVGGGGVWTRLEGEFSSVMCVVTPCRSDKSKRGIIPNGHLSDGRMYLVLVSALTHLPFLRFLLRLARRGLADRCTPHVRVIPVTALRVSPLPGGHSLGGCLWDASAPPSAWNVDGELLYDNSVEIAVQRGAVEVFARGPETAPPAAAGGGGGAGGKGAGGGGGGGSGRS